MTQYQDTNNKKPRADTPSSKTTRGGKDLDALKKTIEQQQIEIDQLKSTVRKLQNEVRAAVNAFNLRHG